MYTLNIIVKCLSVTFGCARRNIQLSQVQLDFVELMQSWIHWCGWQQFLQRVKTAGIIPVNGGYVLETARLRYVTLWGQRRRFWQLLLFLFLLLACKIQNYCFPFLIIMDKVRSLNPGGEG